MVLECLLLTCIRYPFHRPLQGGYGSVLDSLFPLSSAARSRRSGYPDLGGTGKPPWPGRTGRCLSPAMRMGSP